VIRVREGDEIYGFGQHAEDGEFPHFTRGQTCKEQCNERDHPAGDEHPPGRDIFILRLFENQVPRGVKNRAGEQKQDGGDGHNAGECTTKLDVG